MSMPDNFTLKVPGKSPFLEMPTPKLTLAGISSLVAVQKKPQTVPQLVYEEDPSHHVAVHMAEELRK